MAEPVTHRPDCVYETILKEKIDDNTPAKVVDVCGYRRFSLLGRFEGKPGAKVFMEINHRNLLVRQEVIEIGVNGWLNFAKEYTAHAPKIGVVFYNPTDPIEIEMTLYAGL